MRYIPITTILSLLLLGSCLDSTEDDGLDVQAPVIGAPSATEGLAPAQFIDVAADATHIPVAFEVSDDKGLSEVRIETHNAFDGHVHGRSEANDNFVLLR